MPARQLAPLSEAKYIRSRTRYHLTRVRGNPLNGATQPISLYATAMASPRPVATAGDSDPLAAALNITNVPSLFFIIQTRFAFVLLMASGLLFVMIQTSERKLEFVSLKGRSDIPQIPRVSASIRKTARDLRPRVYPQNRSRPNPEIRSRPEPLLPGPDSVAEWAYSTVSLDARH